MLGGGGMRADVDEARVAGLVGWEVDGTWEREGVINGWRHSSLATRLLVLV